MSNIFKNAFLGKAYKTRDKRKAIYRTHCCTHHLFTENVQFTCNDEGCVVNTVIPIPELDIVSEWQEPTAEKETVYIRFGEIPKNGNSAIWKGDKCVGYEDGVSVYEAHRNIDGRYAPVIPYPLTPTTLDDFVYHLTYFRGKKYIVRGDLLGNRGSNGEPLLENVEIITEL